VFPNRRGWVKETMRIQLDIPDEDVKELKALMLEARIDTYKGLFSNALTLLYWAVKEVKTGRIIASLDERDRKYKQLAMPILESLSRKPNAEQKRELAGVG
jgi:hypothetical protein